MTNENNIDEPVILQSPTDLEEWRIKLVGKTIVDGDVQVTEQTFHKRDLPSCNRVLGPNTPATRDYIIDRLNVITDDQGRVTTVYYC
ncbi:hypothetical protein BDA99DRAFT_559707 [Phascolomyces articulosus]|uniref:Uncharacterized protein n=1 Tax=Phascolomyces articulosus TaxID=60185 RepID=A0AAD5PE52_9FUNG|nr:hypothetical protein BDA99DRAFT_559707 [Phascolomyces articulosus]